MEKNHLKKIYKQHFLYEKMRLWGKVIFLVLAEFLVILGAFLVLEVLIKRVPGASSIYLGLAFALIAIGIVTRVIAERD